jgi:photosystem II stability/assembly factor-like uncharacterized protein
MKRHYLIALVILLFLSGFLLAGSDDNNSNQGLMSAKTFEGLKFRLIGPAVTSGRIIDFAVNPENIHEYYVAVASGGVWKTTNSGTTFEPVFDKEGSYSIGCVTMDPNNHHVVWVGTGENNSQRSVGYGDGIYKSLDGGKSWKNMGLKHSEHIAKIIVDPRDSQVVYVAAQGPLWGPGGDRGLYKSVDGGNNWQAILTISENTGVTDLLMDPRNPDLLYAASYQRRRHVYTLINGGPESALYKSIDAGKSWRKLESGIPKVDLGRIGLAISPANPDVIYAIIEAADDQGGFFRSIDRGESWEKRSSYMTTSPQYYQEIVADPLDVERVYSLNTYTSFTEDGGKTFNRLGNKFRHVDDHAMWIKPTNPDHFLIGGDGGVYETFDRAKTWNFKPNLPVTQFYRVAVDDAEPFYNVYGGTQDNFSLGGPSRTTSRVGIVNSDWFVTNGGDGFQSRVDPTNLNIVYAQSQYGWLVRYDKKSTEDMGIKPIEGMDVEPYRWNWDSPLIISPFDPNRLYFAANKLFRSNDRGNSWQVISPDLSRQIDRNKLPVMGKVWGVDAVSKNASTSLYGNIVALTESPLKDGLLYAGTDDGLIQVSDDGSKTWRKIEKLPGVPEYTYISYLRASQHDQNAVYATCDNHKNSDFKPYVLKSTDRGKSWKSISGNLPVNGPVYTIAEDHVNPNLLFVGTEFGVFFTVDGGNKWIQLKGGLPTIAIKDIAIQKRENDLVLAAFGRSFYILDDYSPLREAADNSLEAGNAIFPVKDCWMYIQSRTGTGEEGHSFFSADNPPFGATFTYFLKDTIRTQKQIRQEKEKQLRKEGKPVPYPSWAELRAEDDEQPPYLIFEISHLNGEVIRRLNVAPKNGIQRITWDLRFPNNAPIDLGEKSGIDSENENSWMLAMPGDYQVTIFKRVDGVTTKLTGPQKFTANVLGIATLPAKDREALVSFQKRLGALRRSVLGAIKATQNVIEKLEFIRKALQQTPSAPLAWSDQVNTMQNEVDDLQRKLVGDKTISERNGNQPPSISDRVEIIVGDQWRSTSAPTETQEENYRIAGELFEPQLARLKKLVEVDLKSLETEMEQAGAPWTPGRLPEWKK